MFFEVPEEGLCAHHQRGAFPWRESFTYAIAIGELPFADQHLPLGSRVANPSKIEMNG